MPDFVIEFLEKKYSIYCPNNEKEMCNNYRERFISCGEQIKAKLEVVLNKEIEKAPAKATKYKKQFQNVVKFIDKKISEKINEFAAKYAEEQSV
ncbi:MAG: hypothetical protein WCX32_04510 [Clostridia bacterium]|jgi:hypothetical protein|nr:hypothetical protein [Clostridia bacterium]MDD4275818.1 hypothetical protein [Clostridia bacterium]